MPLGGNFWYLVPIGFSINNIGFALCLLPMIPELIELILEKEIKERNIIEADDKLKTACSDMGSGIFVAGLSLGFFVGPIISGVLYDKFEGTDADKYLNTSRCIAGLALLVFILYLSIGGSYKGFMKST